MTDSRLAASDRLTPSTPSTPRTQPMPDGGWTVNRTMLERPETVRVFNALGIDACCGGMQTLATAAADVGVPLADLLATLAGAAA